MNYRALVLIMLFSVPLVGVPAELVQAAAACNTARGQNTPVMANELDFDALEDQALSVNAYDGIQFAKPSRLMVLLRIVGMPLFNAYLKLTDTMNSLSIWFKSKVSKTQIKSS